MADTLVNIPGLTPAQGAELGDTIFESPGASKIVSPSSGLWAGIRPGMSVSVMGRLFSPCRGPVA